MSWKKNEICLAPYDDSYYGLAEVIDIKSDGIAVKFVTPEIVDGREHHRTKNVSEKDLVCVSKGKDDASWKSGDLCLVACPEEKTKFMLATVVKVEDANAIIKIGNTSGSDNREDTPRNYIVPVSDLLQVIKKVEPNKKGYPAKLAFGLLGAAGMAVLAPVAIPAAVGVLGFGAGGIVAGTPAAAFMASYGGAVASGSACAVLQSIGAAGLGATGTLIGGAAGGALGGAAGVAAGEVVDRLKKDNDTNKED